ncbi:mandelate racemase/muconate lactonizing enzyme family protein [Eubacteriales bacterium OttesenSCG-928-N13]|nr:mandelate racemase/muconate lactonizing enzyme family protein [Eubacteriales bacterium OttesenSCG-928-N13]
MKITDIKTRLLHTPVESALLNKTKSRAFMEIILLEIQTDEGITGHGYTYTDGFGGPAIKTLLDTDIRALIVGRDPMDVKAMVAYVLWELRQAGFAGITVLGTAAMDLALWDIYSQAVHLPIGKILGQYRDKVPMYASVAGWIGLPMEEMVARARELVVDQGMLGIKIQVGRAPIEIDQKRLSMLRDALGAEAKLFVDANTILDVPTAIRLGKAIQDYDIFWLEEPIPLRDTDGHAQISQHIDIPLATGENFFGIRDCDEYIRRRLVSYMQADVIRVGGITEWMRIAALADAHGMRMSPHFVMEMTTEVQCCVQNSLFVEYIPWFQQYFVDPIHTEGGFAYARQKPGLGLAFKESVIAQYAVD